MPTPTSVIEIPSVAAFHQALRDTTWAGRFLFRGEKSCSYSLRSKYGRFAVEDKRNTPGRERSLLADFKRRSAPHLNQLPQSDWEWLAIAQHFGLATRLLDWTENPLVGAFFATRDQVGTADAVLYVLDLDKIPLADTTISPFDIQEPVLYYPPHVASRITSQAGAFTAHADPATEFTSSALAKWVIKKECIIDLALTLSFYGITESFVFGDLESLSRDLNVKWVWGLTQP